MEIQLIRQATLKMKYNDHIILVDPMFSPRGSLDPVANAENDRRNPLVDLPLPVEKILKGVEAVIITHLHRDHLDDAAIQSVSKDVVVFCQPEDEGKLKEHGFSNVIKVNADLQWNGIKLSRTGGSHGTGELAKAMGPVSGFVLEADSEETLYIAGDTVWCAETEEAIRNYKPDVIIVNGGEAQFQTGDPITMGLKDIVKVRNHAADSLIAVAHMEAWNHCLLKRETVMEFIISNGIKNVIVPYDGEKITR